MTSHSRDNLYWKLHYIREQLLNEVKSNNKLTEKGLRRGKHIEFEFPYNQDSANDSTKQSVETKKDTLKILGDLPDCFDSSGSMGQEILRECIALALAEVWSGMPRLVFTSEATLLDAKEGGSQLISNSIKLDIQADLVNKDIYRKAFQYLKQYFLWGQSFAYIDDFGSSNKLNIVDSGNLFVIKSSGVNQIDLVTWQTVLTPFDIKRYFGIDPFQNNAMGLVYGSSSLSVDSNSINQQSSSSFGAVFGEVQFFCASKEGLSVLKVDKEVRDIANDEIKENTVYAVYHNLLKSTDGKTSKGDVLIKRVSQKGNYFASLSYDNIAYADLCLQTLKELRAARVAINSQMALVGVNPLVTTSGVIVTPDMITLPNAQSSLTVLRLGDAQALQTAVAVYKELILNLRNTVGLPPYEMPQGEDTRKSTVVNKPRSSMSVDLATVLSQDLLNPLIKFFMLDLKVVDSDLTDGAKKTYDEYGLTVATVNRMIKESTLRFESIEEIHDRRELASSLEAFRNLSELPPTSRINKQQWVDLVGNALNIHVNQDELSPQEEQSLAASVSGGTQPSQPPQRPPGPTPS